MLAVFGVASALWYWFEGRWDQRLFADLPGGTCVNLDAAGAREWMRAHPQTQVLDVRSPREFRTGCLPGAVNLSLGAPDFRERLSVLSRTQPVLVYCAGGYRSRKAVEHLRELGFTTIRHLHRGYLSWKD